MPSGKTHAIATALTAGALGPGLALLSGAPVQYAAAFTAGCLAGLILSPDLDVRHSTESQRLVRRTGGCLLGAAWSLLWWPYAHLIIPRHRHPLSHFPLLGTALRLGYLVTMPFLLWWLVRLIYPLPSPALPAITPLFIWGICGLALIDTLHFALDWLWPFG